MDFDSTLGALLKERGWLPIQLAAAMAEQGNPVDALTVRRWLSGARKPRAETLPAIASALGVSIDDLYPKPVLS